MNEERFEEAAVVGDAIDREITLASSTMGYRPPIVENPQTPADEFRDTMGIELIHDVSTPRELNTMWRNWNRMTPMLKKASNRKSRELFGKTNGEHYDEILSNFDSEEDEDNGTSTPLFAAAYEKAMELDSLL